MQEVLKLKNIERNLLLIITAVFLVLLLSVFITRQENNDVISLSEIENTVTATVSIANGKVNINTADEKQLQDLPKIGETLAKRIVAYRQEHGNFEEIEDITNVSGIGTATFEAIADYITIGE